MNRVKQVFCAAVLLTLVLFAPQIAFAQQTLGAINGTVTDTTGAVVPKAAVKARNIATNLEVTAETKEDGSFNVVDLPIGNYEVTFSKERFQTEVHSSISVLGARTTTVNGKLSPGEVTTRITVTSTPLLNETDTSNGYTLGGELMESIPLGTGSFTQLAILSPGVHADFLSGSGSNEGLGNQAIWANGQRDTSNSFTFNSVNANNLFNGKSTSYDSTSRFILNTGENFAAGGQVQTNTSVYDAIGQGLPTPPIETIQELQVTTSMYDASMGQNSGAHIELTTKSGTNEFHGGAYDYYQSNNFDATPTFLTPNPFFKGAPPLARNVAGGMIGGPIIKNKLFFFGSYQGQRISDALNGSLGGAATLPGLSDTNRDALDLVNLVNKDDNCGQPFNPKCTTVGQVDSTAIAILNAKAKNGQFIIPSENSPVESSTQLFNAFVKGNRSTFNADQVNGNVDYVFNSKDRLAGKYYFQNNPATSPFAVSQVLGFPQSLQAGSQVFSLDNTTILTPNTTWEQRIGFIREIANATTAQQVTPGDVNINLLGSTFFPGITIDNADVGATVNDGSTVSPFRGNSLRVGPATNFANAGVFQNQFEGSSTYHWIVGHQAFAFGFNFDYTRLNVENRENDVATFTFRDFGDFLTGTLGQDRSNGRILSGETNRHFAAKQAGLFAQDNIKVKSNLTVNLGVRWDWDGPLYERNGLLTNFYPSFFNYQLSSDSFVPVGGTPGIGLVVAGNNKTFGTKGVSDSTLTARQWGFAPRLGVAWSPNFLKNFVVRAGAGMYYDRGEFFTEFSPSAGLGISGPFGVTTQEPFTIPVNASCVGTGCLAGNPFGSGPLPTPPTSLSGPNSVASLVHNQQELSGCAAPFTPTCTPVTDAALAFLFAGYAPTNKLPYSENWSLDLQWQPYNTLVLTLGYVGNHGVHGVLPIPFNQPGIATASNPINGNTTSYGYQPLDASGNGLVSEQIQTTIGEFSNSDGNTALRVPFIGFNPNSDLWVAEGNSNYHALELQVTKRMSHGFQVNASYTYSHSLDEGSGAGLFFNGNNPLDPRTSYGSSDFDRTHVFTISYLYQFPKMANVSRLVDAFVNGWGISGVTVAQSGQPFSIIDFSGSAGGLFFSADDFVTNPIVPLAGGISPKQATNTNNRTNGSPYVNPNDFSIPLLNPGQDGIPACGPTVGGTSANFCDTVETGFGPNGRNLFRSPFQLRFDMSVTKTFKVTERVGLKFEADAFNLFNHPSLDAPNNNFTLNPCFNPQPCYTTTPDPTQGFGVIQNSIGSPRFLQLSLHLTF